MDKTLSFQLNLRTVAVVLAGGRGARLKQLTDRRAKPAVYFAGKFRIIDFALSNCLNSGIRRIAVLTQYKSHSLMRHLQRGWGFLKSEINEFVDLLPAQQRTSEEAWYRGTADAVFQNADILWAYRPRPDYFVILAGDHVYKMNYGLMLAEHVERRAECSVACVEVPRAEASAFGVMAVDEDGLITDFLEKPANPPPIPGKPDRSLVSMGIYVFNSDYLYAELDRDRSLPGSRHDFGRDIIPDAVRQRRAYAHAFEGSCVVSPEERGHPPYWRDVGTVDAYWQANIDLTDPRPGFDLFDREWPIWTYQEQLPPAKFTHDEPGRRGEAIESLVSGGCIISGSLHRSLLFSGCRVHSYAKLDWSVLLPDVEVCRGARLTRCVVDRGCRIPPELVVGEDAEADARRFYRTAGGVTLVTGPMLAKLD